MTATCPPLAYFGDAWIELATGEVFFVTEPLAREPIGEHDAAIGVECRRSGGGSLERRVFAWSEVTSMRH